MDMDMLKKHICYDEILYNLTENHAKLCFFWLKNLLQFQNKDQFDW